MQHHGMPLRHHCVPTLLCSKYSIVIGFWPRGKRGRVDHQNTCHNRSESIVGSDGRIVKSSPLPQHATGECTLEHFKKGYFKRKFTGICQYMSFADCSR